MKRNGFVNILIIIVLVLGLAAIGFFIIPKSKSKISQKPPAASSQPIAYEASDFDLGPPAILPDEIYLEDTSDSPRLKLYNREGKLLTKCKDITSRSIISPNLQKFVYSDNDSLYLATDNCVSKKQIVPIAIDWTKDYVAIGPSAISWSPDSNRLLYILRDWSSNDNRLPPPDTDKLNGIYLYDLRTNKSNKINSPEEAYQYEFLGWPQGSKNPIFSKSLNNNQIMLELNLETERLERIGQSTFGTYLGQHEFLNKNTILWSYMGGVSQILLSTLDRSIELAISPRGIWADYQSPHISPDKKKIGYIKSNNPNQNFQLMIYDLDSKTSADLGSIETILFQWFDNNEILYNFGKDVELINIETKERKLFAKDASLVNPYATP